MNDDLTLGITGKRIHPSLHRSMLSYPHPRQNFFRYRDRGQFHQPPRLIVDRKALDLDPGFVIANGGLSNAYSQKGMYKEAVEHYLRGLDPPETVKSLRGAFEKSGWRGFLEQTLERERVALNTYETAKAYSRLGEKEQALKWLEQVYERRDFMLYLVKIDPDFDALRSDPRFEEIIRGMGL